MWRVSSGVWSRVLGGRAQMVPIAKVSRAAVRCDAAIFLADGPISIHAFMHSGIQAFRHSGVRACHPLVNLQLFAPVDLNCEF